MSLYERVGGDEYFHALAGIFYDGIDGDPVLRTWARGKANLAELLIQYWGGPHDYSARRGHPRLRMRHFPFAIGGREREAWVHRMSEAVRMSQMSGGDVDGLLGLLRDCEHDAREPGRATRVWWTDQRWRCEHMTYVICEPCIGVKDRACVDECPVDCIYEGEDQLYIHPDECVDGDACLPACPVDAIYPGDKVPGEWKDFIQKNAQFFVDNPDAAGGASESPFAPSEERGTGD